MPKYLISYRKTEEPGHKPEWTSFTTDSDASLESHAVRERVDKRMSVLGEQLWGSGEVAWIGKGSPRGPIQPDFSVCVDFRQWSPCRLSHDGTRYQVQLSFARAFLADS